MTNNTLNIRVIIPAYNEADSIGKVLDEIPHIVKEVIVVNNNSTDATKQNAKQHGATVLDQPQMGYGYACLKGIAYLQQIYNESPTDIVVFLDGDYSDYPEDLIELVKPIIEDQKDLVIGARVKEFREKGSMTPQQVFGNALACFLMKHLYKAEFTDLGPFRAIRYDKLLELDMQDKTYGWTIEMQLKVLRKNFSYQQVKVRYKKRIGVSKVSGTVKGTIFAGIKILSWIFKHSFS